MWFHLLHFFFSGHIYQVTVRTSCHQPRRNFVVSHQDAASQEVFPSCLWCYRHLHGPRCWQAKGSFYCYHNPHTLYRPFLGPHQILLFGWQGKGSVSPKFANPGLPKPLSTKGGRGVPLCWLNPQSRIWCNLFLTKDQIILVKTQGFSPLWASFSPFWSPFSPFRSLCNLLLGKNFVDKGGGGTPLQTKSAKKYLTGPLHAGKKVISIDFHVHQGWFPRLEDPRALGCKPRPRNSQAETIWAKGFKP